MAIYLLQPLWTGVAVSVLRDTGFYAWYYGPDFVAEALGAKSAAQQAAQTRLQLWAIAAAFPFWFASAALLLWRLPAAYRRDIGVSLGRFSHRTNFEFHLLVGFAGWLVIAPVSFGVNVLLVWLYGHYGARAEEHPLTATAQSGPMQPIEWALLAFGVLVSAAIWEELFFRGVLLALCRKLRDRGGHVAMMLALASALLLRREQLATAVDAGFLPLLLAGMPALFVLAMAPLYGVVCWWSREGDGPAIFGTALLFAAVHSFAWPTPVALFLLGLGLGWLATRTRSLIAPIFVHALFNAVSFVLLYFEWFTG